MKVMILCGGMGTRIRDVAEWLPKPMVPIGNHPIVWHIMKYYAHFGFREFVLCLGYRGEVFTDYFLHYKTRNSDLTIELRNHSELTVHNSCDEDDWVVTLANTGLHAMTGARVSRACRYVDEEDFMLTYGDGLSDVNLHALVEYHKIQKKLITVTAVHPSGRFGEMELDRDSVTGFNEKPQTRGDFINGGFMVVNKEFVRRYLSEAHVPPAAGERGSVSEGSELVLEREPMRQSARDGQMAAFRHEGFWQCMDTARERDFLDQLWSGGQCPWKVWREHP